MKKLTSSYAKSFAKNWISSWNSHDIDLILSHYSDDFIIESQIAYKFLPLSGGRIVGKSAVKEYWTIGLNKNKKLHFKLLDVLVGINGLTIYYINTTNKLRAVEMMIFNDDGKVQKAFVHHTAS